jgi:hypothetical protein
MSKSIATGAPLNSETFDDFVVRLRYDCDGDGVKRHYTADAFFIVQQKVRTYGYTEDYSDLAMIYRDDYTWYSIKEFWDSLDEDERKTLDVLTDRSIESGMKFVDAGELNQWYILENEQTEFSVVRYKEDWEYVNAHFTRDAAEAFIKRKKHDYEELRVYVDSQYWCWEFVEIKKAILSGKLKYVE